MSRPTLDAFMSSLTAAHPPADLPPALVALWHDANNDWEAAHRIAQDIDDDVGAWVHAYLHRREGDLDNAAYWYRRAGRPAANDVFNAEWSRIVRALVEPA